MPVAAQWDQAWTFGRGHTQLGRGGEARMVENNDAGGPLQAQTFGPDRDRD